MNTSKNFTEDHPDSAFVFTATEIVIGATFLVFLMLLAFFGNLLTCIVFCQKSQFHTPTNVSIAILTVSDILSAVFVMPFSLTSFIKGRWIWGQTACVFNAHSIMALIGLTFISMTCTAVIRYLKVVKPSLQPYLKPKRTLILVSILWLVYLLLISLPEFVEFPEGRYNEKRGFCRLHYNKRKLKRIKRVVQNLIITFGVLLALIMFTAYYKVFRCVARHNQMVVPNLQQGMSVHIEEAKVTKTLAIVVIGFLVCWVPTGIIEAMNTTYIIHRIRLPVFARFLQTMFIFTSSAINPLIYTLTNRRFRRKYLVFLSTVLGKCKGK